MSNGTDNAGKAATYIGIVKTLGGWVLALVMVVLGAVFWIQNEGDDKYYPKLKGEALEQQVQKLDKTLEGVEKQNNEMIRLLYEMKGRSHTDTP